jgi:hypothetical protein
MSKFCQYAVLCLITGCISTNSAYPSQPWQRSSQTGVQPILEASLNDYEDDTDGEWLCTAQGSVGTAHGDGPWSFSTETARGSAATHDDAFLKAIADCNSLVTTSSTLAMSAGEQRQGGACTVSNCIGPRQTP